MLEAAIERADGDDACIIRRQLARDQRLQRRDDAGGGDDGVLGILRIGAVAADAGDLDVDAVDIRHHIARADTECARGERRIVVQADDMVGLREAREQAVLDHAERTEPDLFGGLGDHHQRAFPAGLVGDKIARGSDPDGHVDVVAARMHHAGLFPAPCRVARFRCVGQPGLLDERQRIHVGADHQRGAGSVLEHGDKAVAADAVLHRAVVLLRSPLRPRIAETSGDLEAEALHLGGKDGGGVLLLEGQFGMGVQVFVELAKRLALRLERGLGICGLRRGSTGRQQGYAEGEDGVLHGSAPVCGCVAGRGWRVDRRTERLIR